MKVCYTAEAESDLDTIGAYTEKVWGAAQCDRYIDMLQQTIERLLPEANYLPEHPHHPGLFRFHAERHYIYFTRSEGSLTVVRILHDSMLPERHL